jgi:hypothetical protein
MRKKSNSPTAKLIQELTKLSHDYIRRRDSIDSSTIGGHCFDCGRIVHGSNFQCGHFIPDASGGALLRYHPQNMHGQSSGCNMAYSQERVKPYYTLAMIKKYGQKRVEELMALKNRTIKADEIFYSKMIELYKEGNEKKIIKYLESL